MPEVKRILGEHLISDAPAYEDQRRNTDLMIGDRELVLAAIRVGVRIRDHEFLIRYPNDYTIRTNRLRSGNETELAKIIRGYGDYFFYGIAGVDESTLGCWVIIDLAEWRLWFMHWLAGHQGELPGPVIRNADGSSAFMPLGIDELPTEAIRARVKAEPMPSYAASDFDEMPF